MYLLSILLHLLVCESLLNLMTAPDPVCGFERERAEVWNLSLQSVVDVAVIPRIGHVVPEGASDMATEGCRVDSLRHLCG